MHGEHEKELADINFVIGIEVGEKFEKLEGKLIFKKCGKIEDLNYE